MVHENHMVLTLDKIKKLYQFKVLKLTEGQQVIEEGKCSQWTRRKELKYDKDLIYIYMELEYRGMETKTILYKNFYLEDSEGYLNHAMPPEDYLYKIFDYNSKGKGGMLFSLYRDIRPKRLWFDTKICYQNLNDPILIDILLPISQAKTRTEVLTEEYLAKCYSKQLGDNNQLNPKPTYKIENMVSDLLNKHGLFFKKTVNGYIVRIKLSTGRKQNIILNFNEKDQITIGTICAPATNKKNDRLFLQMNPTLNYGAIGIAKIEKKDYYVITETLAHKILTKEIIYDSIDYIASKGDWLEKKLTGGLDIQ